MISNINEIMKYIPDLNSINNIDMTTKILILIGIIYLFQSTIVNAIKLAIYIVIIYLSIYYTYKYYDIKENKN